LNNTNLQPAHLPFLLDVLSLSSRGLSYLNLSGNMALGSSSVRAIIRLVHERNHSIQYVGAHGCDEQAFGYGVGTEGEVLSKALERNVALRRNTRKAAVEVLRVARVVLLPVRAAENGSSLEASFLSGSVTLPSGQSRPFPILSLPPDLLHPIFASIRPAWLTHRQVTAVLNYAEDRSTLTRSRREEDVVTAAGGGDRNDRLGRNTDGEELMSSDEVVFLKEVGCFHTDWVEPKLLVASP
jgi:hypothetical protein